MFSWESSKHRRSGVSNRSGLGAGDLTKICYVLEPSLTPRDEPNAAPQASQVLWQGPAKSGTYADYIRRTLFDTEAKFDTVSP